MLVVGNETKILKTKAIILLAITLFCSCSSNLQQGVYKNRFAENGFFITKIKLNDDNTFDYSWSGDLLHYQNTGIYKIERKNLILDFKQIVYKIDTVVEVINGVDIKIPIKIDSIFGNNGPEPPEKFLIKRKKLWAYNIESGKVVKYAIGYSKVKKYLFWGSNYKKKRYFLQRVK